MWHMVVRKTSDEMTIDIYNIGHTSGSAGTSWGTKRYVSYSRFNHPLRLAVRKSTRLLFSIVQIKSDFLKLLAWTSGGVKST